LNILSIDWDFFFSGASEFGGGCSYCSWKGCKRFWDDENYYPRPKVRDDVERPEADPFDQLFGHPVDVHKAELYVAECHADIWPILTEKCFVAHLDAHADTASEFSTEFRWNSKKPWQDFLYCGNWLRRAQQRKRTSSKWLIDPIEIEFGFKRKHAWTRKRYKRVFICQSKPWTPRGWDRRFYQFVRQVHDHLGGEIAFLGPHAKRLEGGYLNT